jgi:ribonuclease P/MRP protein subunit POP8
MGLTGTAIPIDILKLENACPPEEKYDSVWIRVPREDAAAVVGAVSSWIGGGNKSAGAADVAWRISAKGNFLGALIAGSGADLFVP